ncbi:MAG TPA: ATP-grasp domain-containing protein [Clostridia bacterium]|nr:ATP-grasp domain-containing protein [Clostridia bacterium]
MMEAGNLLSYITEKRDKGIIIWLCNIGAEKYWNVVSSGMSDKYEDAIVNRIEEMNVLICRKQDILILREKPDAAYLEKLEEIGVDIPNILVPVNLDQTTPISELVLKDDKLLSQLREIAGSNNEVYFAPYAVTCLEEQIAERCNLRLIGSSSKVNAIINDKIFNRRIAEELNFPVCEGRVCSSIEEIRQEFHRLTGSLQFGKVIIKEPFGASGKGLYIIEDEARLEATLRIIGRLARKNAEAKWLVEGWYEKKVDINYQIYIAADGSTSVFSIKQQVLRGTVYIGSKIPPELTEAEIQAIKKCGEQIGNYLYGIGYTGVAGVDSFITVNDILIPIIEINGRFTLSTYISFLDRITGGSKIITRYFRLSTKSILGYRRLLSMLEEKGIDYSTEKKEGVIIYTAGTFTSGFEDGNGCCAGRIFALIASKEEEKMNDYVTKLEEIIESINF